MSEKLKWRQVFCCVVFGGEVDCCEKNDNAKYIELKTSRVIESAKQDSNFKRYYFAAC